MRLLDRYQLREALTAFVYCLSGILVFWMSFELLGEIDELGRRNVGVWDTVVYLFHRLPIFMVLQIPVSLLLALLYTLTQHARHNELVAMRAAGISVWRISAPYLGLGVALSLGMMALNEFAAPDAAERADAVLLKRSGKDQAEAAGWREGVYFIDSVSRRSWQLAAFNVETSQIRGAHVQWLTDDGGREEMIAERGWWENGVWVFEDVTRFTFSGTPGRLPEKVPMERWEAVGFPETPAHLRSEVKISRLLGGLKKSRKVQLSLREILKYRELHRELSPRFDALLKTWFHDRIAAPWTCLVVALIGVATAAGSGRKNAFVGVALAIFLAFGFFVLKEFSLAAGSGGYLPPWVAAWLPNVVFGGVAAWGIQRTR
jgi:lipopolysaccharide export system permease protein